LDINDRIEPKGVLMGEILIELARASIAIALGISSDFDLQQARQTYPTLNQKGAVFITLTQDQKLRGCIGSLTAHRPLYKDIIINAKLSALSDSRFSPLTAKEFAITKIEISLLSAPKAIEYSSITQLQSLITPQDGVVLTLGDQRATYLPSVWESLPNFDSFFASLCQKAGLKANCLSQHPSIELYQATKYKEK